MGEVLGGAWIGGTIDSTGAVAAAGAMLGEPPLDGCRHGQNDSEHPDRRRCLRRGRLLGDVVEPDAGETGTAPAPA